MKLISPPHKRSIPVRQFRNWQQLSTWVDHFFQGMITVFPVWSSGWSQFIELVARGFNPAHIAAETARPPGESLGVWDVMRMGRSDSFTISSRWHWSPGTSAIRDHIKPSAVMAYICPSLSRQLPGTVSGGFVHHQRCLGILYNGPYYKSRKMPLDQGALGGPCRRHSGKPLPVISWRLFKIDQVVLFDQFPSGLRGG